jgi:hypothetical protein
MAATLLGVLLLGMVLLLAACGSGSRRSSGKGSLAPTVTAARASTKNAGDAEVEPDLVGCKGAIVHTYFQTAERIDKEAEEGSETEAAAHRVSSSTALASAISSGDRAAVRAALRGLLAGQIVRIQIIQHGKVLASLGSGRAVAPVSGSIAGTEATYVLSTQRAAGLAEVTARVIGGPVVLYSSRKRIAGTIAGPPPESVAHDGPMTIAGHKYHVTSYGTAVYPSGGLQVALFVPRSALKCTGSLLQAQTETLGRVAERVYRQEVGGSRARTALRGYMTLAHLFTLGDVLLRVGPHGERQVMGTLDPGPENIPDRGLVAYDGKSYQAYSFTGKALPSSPLRISLLLPNELEEGV